MNTIERIAGILEGGANDPMWAAHAEMPKSALAKAACLLREQNTEIERLRAERDAAVADAERYRWLRDHAPNYWLLEWGVSDAEVDRARGEQK